MKGISFFVRHVTRLAGGYKYSEEKEASCAEIALEGKASGDVALSRKSFGGVGSRAKVLR